MSTTAMLKTAIAILLTLSMIVGCRGGEQLRPDEPTAPSEPGPLACEQAGESEELDSSETDEPFAWSAGTYWVRRQDLRSVRTSVTATPALAKTDGDDVDASPDEEISEPRTTTTTRGRTQCVRLTFDPDARRTLELREFRLTGHSTPWKFTFRTTETEDGWSLHEPRVSREHVQLSRECTQEMIVEPMVDAVGVLASNAGPIFTERDRCKGAPSKYVRDCQDGECNYEEPTAQPFILSGCEGAMGALRTQVETITGTSHATAMQTLDGLDELIRQGGTLWERQSGEDSCADVSITPKEGDHLHVIRTSTTDDGGYVERRRRYEFRPLFHDALYYSQGSTTYDAEGTAIADEGSGWGHRIPRVALYLADGAIFLDDQFLYLDRAACEESQSD